MPRDSQGLYTLPAGNPVSPGTLIESEWANPTMSDIAQALTDSLPRNGAAPMVGPLTLVSTPPVAPRHAASKAYVDQFVAYSSGLPVGAIITYASGSIPAGYFICNGQAISRTTYSALFALIGTSFGTGDGSTTFNIPNLVDQFIRGRNPATRTAGSTQGDAFRTHLHPVNDPTHSHVLTDPTHTHAQAPHTHAATQAPHTHNVNFQNVGDSGGAGGMSNLVGATPYATTSAQPAITVGDANPAIAAAAAGITLANASTGLSVGAVGDSETRPMNMAFDFLIKAAEDSSGPVSVLSIDTGDSSMIAIDSTNPTIPILDIKANVAFGTVKLDGAGKIPAFLLPVGNQNLLGLFDASTGNNPSEEYPAETFLNGDTFIVGVQGTIDVFDPSTNISAPTLVDIGTELIYLVGALTNPDGWYYVEAAALVTAAQVSYIPMGGVSATNVQAAITELDTEKVSGPATATDNSLARFDGTSGKLLKNGAIIGVDVQPYDATILKAADIGTSVEPYDATILKAADIGAYVAASGANADITSMTALTAPTVAANPMRATDVQAQLATAFTTGGTGTAFTLTPTPAITAYAANQEWDVVFSAACGAAPTFQVSGLGTPPNLVKQNADGTYSNLAAGDFPSGWSSKVKMVSPTQALVRSLPLKAYKEIQPIAASVAANALTVTLNPTTLDFRSATLGSGAVNTRTVLSPISLTISSGSTLGTVNGVESQIVILAIDNAGTVELAAVNIAGGVNLDETTLINTTAEGGAGGADSATVIYSQTSRTGVPFRVVGFVESTQATAGTWATAPSLVQGYGGQALAAMASLGYGQTMQVLTGSRAYLTTYYNTTGKPIWVSITGASALTSQVGITVNGVLAANSLTVDGTSGSQIGVSAIVPPGASYSAAGAGALATWIELR